MARLEVGETVTVGPVKAWRDAPGAPCVSVDDQLVPYVVDISVFRDPELVTPDESAPVPEPRVSMEILLRRFAPFASDPPLDELQRWVTVRWTD